MNLNENTMGSRYGSHVPIYLVSLGILVVLSVVVACLPSGEETPARQEETSAAPIAKGFHEVFGDSVLKASDRETHQFQGDFDGDGAMDQMFVVEATGKAGDIPEGVTVWDSWSNQSIDPLISLSDRQGVSLAILHGFKSTQGSNAFLLYDQRPISVLDAGAARDMSLLSRSSFSKEIPELDSMAKGDALIIPTESGIDTYLYWDGATYRFYEPEDIP